MTKDLTTTKSPIAIGAYQGSRSILLNTLSEIHTFATMVTKTDLVPKGYRGKPEDATVAIIYGMEIGLPPMSSLQNISVVNGTPAVWGDAQLSLVQSSGKYEYHKSSYDGEFGNDNFKAIFEVKRTGSKEPIIKEFSIGDAKKAALWGKSGTWTSHPKVMLSYKARAFALREGFADILKGMHSAEEMEGEQMIDATPRSKTANAHAPLTPPASIEQSFKMPEPVQTDIVDHIVTANEMEAEQIITDSSDVAEQAFNRVEQMLNTIITSRGIDNYWERSAKEDLEYLGKEAPKMYSDLVLLKNKRLGELNGK